MRGELALVWSDTWREIWAPLGEDTNAPEDLFCELYRELVQTIKEPSNEQFVGIVLNDALHSREAFHRALFMAGANFAPEAGDQLYDDALRVDPDSPVTTRRHALENALLTAIGRPINATAIFGQALLELAANPKRRGEARSRILEAIYNSPIMSEQAFRGTLATDLSGERAVIGFLESAHGIIDEMAGDELSNRYFCLLASFIEKFSLRYDLRRPCVLCPTLPGVFSSLVHDLKTAASKDAHLDGLMKDYEDAIRDLRAGCSDNRIKTCMFKQVNLLEAMGRRHPGVTAKTVGQICNQVGTWPHASVKEAMKNLYEFTNDYPGIRHGGTPANALRSIEMRDMVAMSILLAGFMPYLTDQVDANLVYRGA